MHQRSGERETHERARHAREPGDLQRGDACQHGFLRNDTDGVEDGGGNAQQRAPARREAVLRGRAPDHHRAGESDAAPGQQPPREPLTEDETCEQGDQDRPDVHQHRRSAGVDPSLRLVQCDVVRTEPGDPAEGDRWKVAERRERFAAHEHDEAERDARDRQPAERERLGES